MENRVLHIISGLGQGGAERQLIELVKQNNSHAICSLTSGGYFEKEARKNGITIWSIGMGDSIFNPLFIFRLKKVVSIFKPQLIHCWMYHACLITVFLKYIFGIQIPILWGIRCSDMDTSKYSYKLRLVILGCKLFSKSVKCIIYNSESGKDFHSKIGFSKKNSIVIPNGIAVDSFKPNAILRKKIKQTLKIREDTKVLLNVARLDPMKGQDNLLSVFKNIRSKNYDVILILAGSGTDKLEVPQDVIALGECKNIEEIYSIGDIIISSSEYGEGFSNALAEGMASGFNPSCYRCRRFQENYSEHRNFS